MTRNKPVINCCI